MGFMVPVAERLTMYEVETNSHTELVPEDALSAGDFDPRGRVRRDALLKYVEGTKIFSFRKRRGWYGRLSAPGYMDATEWDGPHKSKKAALDAVKRFHDVDDDGDSTSEW